MFQMFIKIVCKPISLLVVALVMFVAITSVLWSKNASLYYMGLRLQPDFLEKVRFFMSTYESLVTNFTRTSAILLVGLSLLLGIYVVLFVAYIRRSRSPRLLESSPGFFGFLAGLFGIGCAACGTVILSGLLGVFGGTAIIAALPFAGLEIALLGIGILLFGNFYLLKKLSNPLVCPI